MASSQIFGASADAINSTAAALKANTADAGEESLIILQSLLCLLREKNLLSRADIESLCHKIEARAAGKTEDPIPCCNESAVAAASSMQRITRYIGQRYGGKPARIFR